MDNLKNIPAEDLPYLKLLKPQNELKPITLGKVKMFHIAAVAVAQAYGSNYGHLQLPADEFLKEFHDAVHAIP